MILAVLVGCRRGIFERDTIRSEIRCSWEFESNGERAAARRACRAAGGGAVTPRSRAATPRGLPHK